MKLYYWLHDWQLPGQQHKGASKVEVPTDAAGLCAWLNERRVPICLSLVEPPLELSPDLGPPRYPELPAPIPAAQSTIEASAIEDFLLNRATVAECECIFAALGCRFAEARRAAL